jgi:radical SAM protein with 4Fe4S-binding SPASM domain
MRRLSAADFFDALAGKAFAARTPVSATIELTYGCNLRCVHCCNPTHEALPHELATTEVCSVLEQVADLGVVELHVSGGEPMVRPDVFEIFRHAKALGFVLHLLSNATGITPAAATALEDLGFASVNVSISGATRATYERVSQVPGSHARFLGGLECLARTTLPTIVRMPVMAGNLHEVGPARTLVEQHGAKFQYCTDITPRSDGNPGPLQHRLPPRDKVRLDRAMLGAWETRCAGAGSDSDAFISCACGRSSFAITPYGEMNLCAAFPMPRYDLRAGSVKAGWEVLKHTVSSARPSHRYECLGCAVRPWCRQGRSDAWLETGDMSACLPHFKELAILERRLYERPGRRPVD